ncbi:EAL domain-containing protein [Ketobacter sp.]|uniref:EAL domain-containing protein n=1 Tax=Ketobacter sp. TaxID=2083498 RepID=UPI000F0F64A8|nr:EAL domain-containing protein [Ketobacter sp.]RLT97335.1 MAG: EAL domain-containing protein [Ketobacter sp.]
MNGLCKPALLVSFRHFPRALPLGPAFVLLCLFLLLTWANAAWASDRLVATESKLSVLVNSVGAKQLDVSTYLEITPDPGGNMGLDEVVLLPDIAFEPLQSRTLLSTMESRFFWVRARIRESSRVLGSHSRWMLVLENPLLEGSPMYLAKAGTPRLEDYTQVAPVKGRYLVYPIELVANDTHQFYIRLEVRGATSITAKIWQETAYQLHKRKTLPGWGLLFGGLSALILYNLFVMVSLRETMYFHLSVFLACSLLVTAHTEGFLAQFAGDVRAFRWVGFGAFFQCIALVSAVLFTRAFLQTANDHPMVERCLKISLFLSLFLGGVLILGWLPIPVFFALFAVAGLLFFIPSVIVSLNVSDRGTRYYLAGWSVFIVGYAIYQFGQLGMIPVNDVTTHMKEFALGILGITLSLGIASQIQKERFQKIQGLNQQQETMLELKYTEEQIQKKVLRDTLKEFPDEATLEGVARKVIAAVEETGEAVTLVMVELHHLALVEHKLGHAARNELLTRATKRLSIVLRSITGVVPLQEFQGQYVPMAVLDANRFAFLLRSMDDVAVNFAVDEVESSMQRPFFYQGMGLQPGVSFGVARLNESDASYEKLYDHALRALQADTEKNLKKGYELESVDQYNPRNISLINQLRQAIQEDQISLYFQPVYDLNTRKTCGLEVLTRWDTDVGEKISPSEIFYLAEVGGFVAELTLNVVDKAICYYLAAIDPEENPVKLSVNLSPKCLREERFLEEVGVLLSRYHMPSKMLSFEIKEAAIIEDPSITRESLNRIRAMGIGLTIDEFGAAYSNPSYMSSLPVTEVKLDQRIVARLENKFHFESVSGVIGLCRERDITLVIHGVEDEGTLAKLERMGCTFAQGHFFAAPVKASEYKLNKGPLRRSRYQRA